MTTDFPWSFSQRRNRKLFYPGAPLPAHPHLRVRRFLFANARLRKKTHMLVLLGTALTVSYYSPEKAMGHTGHDIHPQTLTIVWRNNAL